MLNTPNDDPKTPTEPIDELLGSLGPAPGVAWNRLKTRISQSVAAADASDCDAGFDRLLDAARSMRAVDWDRFRQEVMETLKVDAAMDRAAVRPLPVNWRVFAAQVSKRLHGRARRVAHRPMWRIFVPLAAAAGLGAAVWLGYRPAGNPVAVIDPDTPPVVEPPPAPSVDIDLVPPAVEIVRLDPVEDVEVLPPADEVLVMVSGQTGVDPLDNRQSVGFY